MQDKEKLRLLNMSQIDVRKWNHCIINAVNEIVYAYSWYLDVVNYDWEALVYYDYDIVMPLTNSKRYGITCLCQPTFTPYLGIFSGKEISEELVKLFIDNIPAKYRYINVNLNKYNSITALQRVKTEQRFTYQLDLVEHYETAVKKYSKPYKVNLYRAFSNNLSVIQNLVPNELFKLNNIIVKQTHIKYEHLNMLRQLIAASIRYKSSYLYGVYGDSNTIMAAGLFIRSKYTLSLILAVSTEEGKRLNAPLLLIDKVIKDFSGKNITLDFNSNDSFYEGFGANKFTYNNIKINRLPFPASIIN